MRIHLTSHVGGGQNGSGYVQLGPFTSAHLGGTRSTGSGFFFFKECRKLLVVNRPNPAHTARLGKGYPVTPAQQAGGDDSGNPVYNVLLHLPFIYLNLSDDLQ